MEKESNCYSEVKYRGSLYLHFKSRVGGLHLHYCQVFHKPCQFNCRVSVAQQAHKSLPYIPKIAKKSIPRISSGSHTDVGTQSTNEDQHIQIHDLCSHLGS